MPDVNHSRAEIPARTSPSLINPDANLCAPPAILLDWHYTPIPLTKSALMSDLEILHAAFKQAHQLQALYGDAIPWSAIEKGFYYKEKKILFASKAIGIFKPAVMSKGLISIKTVIPKAGRFNIYNDHQSSDDHYHYSLQEGGAHQKNNRYLWEAQALNQPFIYFHGVSPSYYSALFPCFVSEIFDLGEKDSYCNVSVGAELGNLLPPLVDGHYVIPNSFERRYAIRESRARLHQSSFRQAVLSAYQNKCAMTGLPTARLLDAAHIIPDKEENGIAAVQNGIALSKLHHTAYDRHIIGIDGDFKIHVSDEVMAENDGPLLEESIKGLSGRKLIVPSQKTLRPNKDYLAARFEEFLKAN